MHRAHTDPLYEDEVIQKCFLELMTNKYVHDGIAEIRFMRNKWNIKELNASFVSFYLFIKYLSGCSLQML